MSRAAVYVGTAPVLYLDSSPATWVRPAWPALADLTPLNNRFTAVYGVDSTDSNFVSLSVETFSGTYTVDWGDGTTPDSGIASGAQANHKYDYAAITASAVGDFKPVVVTVTTSSGNITTFDLQRKHPLDTSIGVTKVNWLDIAINAASMTSLSISSATPTVRLSALQQVKIHNNSVTSMYGLFSSCRSLQVVSLLNTQSVNYMTSMFADCTALQSVPLFDTSAVIDMSFMFQGCISLQSVPLFDTYGVNGMEQMFSGCRSLQSVPLFNTITVTSMSGMFFDCSSLQSVPLFVISNLINMDQMFQGCSSLQRVPSFDTANVITMNATFRDCSSLQSVPLFNTSQVGNMASMFQNCFSLQSVPAFTTSAVTSMTNMFNGCSSLSIIPPFNTAALTNTGTGFMFLSCSSLCSGRTNGLTRSINYGNCKLSAAALNDVFSGLGAGISSPTITIANNPGAATCNRAIATGKLWTVSG